MSRKATILLYESNTTIRRMMQFNLEMEGFAVAGVAAADDVALRLNGAPHEAGAVDLILLNWTDPGESCLDICKSVRRMPAAVSTPIVVISPPREERDRLNAYEAGADDFVLAPYSLPELLARIRAILRRTSPEIGGRVIRISGVEMDIDNGLVKRDGSDIRLSLIEFKILRYLMENAGKVRTREQIRNAVWGRESPVEIRAVDVRITRLRRRLNIDTRPDVIRTVRSVGYALGEQQPRFRAEAKYDGVEA